VSNSGQSYHDYLQSLMRGILTELLGGWRVDLTRSTGTLPSQQLPPATGSSGDSTPGGVVLSDDDPEDTTSGAADPGTAADVSRADHVHHGASGGASLSDTSPENLSFITSNPGTGDAASRFDHIHYFNPDEIMSLTPSTDLSGSLGAPHVVGIQGIPVLTDAPADGDVLTYQVGSYSWGPLPPSATGGHTHVYNVVPSGAINSSNTVFTLPESAQVGSLRVYRKFSGESGYQRLLGGTAYTEDGSSDATTGKTGIESGHYSSEDASKAIDNNTGTAWAGATPGAGWVGVDFATAVPIFQIKFTCRLAGGYGGVATYSLDYSDNGSYWTTITGTLTNSTNTDGAVVDSGDMGDNGSHRYWRVNIITTATYEPSVKEIEMFRSDATTGSFTMAAAPTTGDLLLVDYDVLA
jgi:hypothetical protein